MNRQTVVAWVTADVDHGAQRMIKHAITAIMVCRTFNSVRENLAPSDVLPVACPPCCWSRDAVVMGTAT